MIGLLHPTYFKVKKAYKGSITLEAAFVMPIVILSVFAVLYLTFYLHDMCRVQGIVDETIHRAGLCMKYEEDPAATKIDYISIKNKSIYDVLSGEKIEAEQKLRTYLQQRLAKGLFLSRIVEVQAKVGINKLEVSVRTESRIRMPWTAKFFRNYTNRVINGDYPVHDPAQTIRVCDVILETAAKVKGMDELSTKIKRFFPSD